MIDCVGRLLIWILYVYVCLIIFVVVIVSVMCAFFFNFVLLKKCLSEIGVRLWGMVICLVFLNG